MSVKRWAESRNGSRNFYPDAAKLFFWRKFDIWPADMIDLSTDKKQIFNIKIQKSKAKSKKVFCSLLFHYLDFLFEKLQFF